MGSGAGAAKETVDALCAPRRAGRCRCRSAVPAVPDRGAAGRAAADAPAPSSCSTAPRSRARRSSRCTSTCCRRCGTARPSRGSAAAAPRDRWPLRARRRKEFTPAMVKAVFDELPPTRRATASPSGIVDDVTHTSLSFDPSFTHRPRPRAGRVLRPRLRRHRRRQQEHGQDRRRATPTSHVQGYFVYDSKKSGSMTVSHLRFDPKRRSIAPTSIDQATFVGVPPVRASSSASTCSASPRPARRSCSTARTRPTQMWDRLPVEVQEQIVSSAASTLHVIDADARRARRRPRGSDQHRDADVLLRARRRAARRRGDRRDRRSRSVDAYGKRGDVVVDATSPRSTRRSRSAAPRRPVPGTVTATAHRRPTGRRPDAPTSCSGSRRGCSPAKATCSR